MRFSMRLVLAIVVSAACLLGQAAKDAPNPVFEAIQDKPGLPRVLLIGDSISIGYTLDTRALLKGKANVHRIGENGGATINGLEKIDKWLGDGKWDVIHFNWGLHDLKFMEGENRQVPLGDYEKNMETLVSRMEKTGAKLIWASTTPVPEGELSPMRKDSDVVAYNKAAAKVMARHKIPTDDLYAFALPRLKKIQRPVNVHFTDEGSAELAGAVAKVILGVLGGT